MKVETSDIPTNKDEIDFITKMKNYIQEIRETRTNLLHRESNAKMAYENEKTEIAVQHKMNQNRCPHINTRQWGQGIDSSDRGITCEDCGKEW